MTLLVDMNLSPAWVPLLRDNGHDAVHWSTVGAPDAPDGVLMEWAAAQRAVVLTSDLDFSAILAASGAAVPSVVQLRMDDLLPDAAGAIVLTALDQFAAALADGALLSLHPSRARARLLPLV